MRRPLPFSLDLWLSFVLSRSFTSSQQSLHGSVKEEIIENDFKNRKRTCQRQNVHIKPIGVKECVRVLFFWIPQNWV